MNVLVIEYEKGKIEKIKDLLFEVDDSIQVVGVADDMPMAADWLTRNDTPDIILANETVMAQLQRQEARKVKTVVTISTHTEKYNYAALRYKTIRQLLEDDMPQLQPGARDPEMRNKTSGNVYKERFLVKQGQRLLSIHVNQVAYFFSQDRFIFLRTFDNQKFLLEYRIEQLESLLSPADFFRVNRSFIISLATVREIHSYFGNRLKLYLNPSTEKDIIVSRKRVQEFKSWLGK